MQRVHISADTPQTAVDWAAVLEAIESGALSPSALTETNLYRAYCAGYRFAELSFQGAVERLQAEVEQERDDADRYYERWQNPGKQFAKGQQRRIDAALEQAVWGDGPLTAPRQFEITVRAAMPPRRNAA